MSKLEQATIRDFSGGWNISDNEYNLSSKYAVESDNIIVDADNSLTCRFGYEFLADFHNGTVDAEVTGEFNLATTDGSPRVVITITGHPFVDGNHITIKDAEGLNGIPTADLNGIFGVRKLTDDTIEIQTRTPANATANADQTISYIRDTHAIAGEIVYGFYFQDHVHVVCSEGEIATRKDGTITNIWNIAKSQALPDNPNGWRRMRIASHDTFRQTALIVNGKDNDKPLEINHRRSSGAVVQYLVDPATGSNNNVYAADLIKAFGGYVLLVNPNNTTTSGSNSPTVIDISALNTSGVFVGNAEPDDAVQVDLGIVTSTIDPTITGIGNIRDNVFVSFNDTAMLGQLGNYNAAGQHAPEFNDQVPQHGALNNRVIHTLGNDLLMCDYTGVPAFSQSVQSGVIVPERLSMFIAPALNQHLARLSQDTLRFKTWAMFNVRDQQYMLFVPKHDENSRFFGGSTPFYVTSELRERGQVIVFAPNHTVMKGDFVVVSGAEAFTGIAADKLNGTREVIDKIDDDFFVLQIGAVPQFSGESGGGASVLFAPIDDETIVYNYLYIPALRARRWTRFRDLYFTHGFLSNNGDVLLTNGSKLFRFGTKDRPLYGDELNMFDSIWAASETYEVGHRVKESLETTIIYECIMEHTSTGTFADDVVNSSKWRVYQGKEIKYVYESPWSDMRNRERVKNISSVRFDATGTGSFKFSIFTDGFKVDRGTRDIIPAASMEFVAKDVGGFGAGDQPFGGGRNIISPMAYDFPAAGKNIKLRIEGQTNNRLKVVSVTMNYWNGSVDI